MCDAPVTQRPIASGAKPVGALPCVEPMMANRLTRSSIAVDKRLQQALAQQGLMRKHQPMTCERASAPRSEVRVVSITISVGWDVISTFSTDASS